MPSSIWRKGYTRKDGVKVRGTWVSIKSKRKSRKPWITRKGKLGGSGFLSKSFESQKRILRNCVKQYGYRSCLGSIMVLNRNMKIKELYGRKIDRLKEYLMNHK